MSGGTVSTEKALQNSLGGERRRYQTGVGITGGGERRCSGRGQAGVAGEPETLPGAGGKRPGELGYFLYLNTASLSALLFSLKSSNSSLSAHLSIVRTLILIAYKLPSGPSTESCIRWECCIHSKHSIRRREAITAGVVWLWRDGSGVQYLRFQNPADFVRLRTLWIVNRRELNFFWCPPRSLYTARAACIELRKRQTFTPHQLTSEQL